MGEAQKDEERGERNRETKERAECDDEIERRERKRVRDDK